MRRAAFLSVFLIVSPVLGQEVRVLHSFERPDDLRHWSFQHNTAEIDTRAGSQRPSLKIAGTEYMSITRDADWSEFDAMEVEMYLDAPEGTIVRGTLLIGDEPWVQNRTYWNRHNAGFTLQPGRNTLSISVTGLYRGEAGSRNNDIPTNIDPAQIRRMDLGFQGEGTVWVDQIRLTSETRPPGIHAFDFGPDDQVLFPGFTPISSTTVHGADQPVGVGDSRLGLGWSRDDTFPTRLYQDWVNLEDRDFVIDLPDGDYHVWLVYADSGYWGGEQARFSQRWIQANGERVWTQQRDEFGPAHYLYRFESIEPRPGDSLWALYVAEMVQPHRFPVSVAGGRLRLRFGADGPLSSKVAALVVYPDAIQAEAEAWLEQIEQRNRAEFEARAAFVGPQPRELNPPADAVQHGWWIGFPGLEQDVTLLDAPGPERSLHRAAAQGQRINMTFAIRPLRQFEHESVSLEIGDLAGPGAAIPAGEVDLRYVHHSTRRGFNDIAYTIAPETVRPVAGSDLRLEADLTRQFWVTVHIPDGTPAGTYTANLTLHAGELAVELPVSVEVLGFALDEPDFIMGYYGLGVPPAVQQQRGEQAMRELLAMIRRGGMNSFTGGPNITFSGFTEDGRPQLDFSAADRFFQLVREAGFDKPVISYGGPGMVQGLHDGYVIGNTGRNWERQTGRPFGELLAIVWGAVRDHAEANDWPTILINLSDEPRVLERAEAELELMRAYRAHAPWVQIGGSYSVHWERADPLEQTIQEIFRTLNWSAVNLHSQRDLDEAERLGKQLLVYNQGRSRYSFGVYQWAQMNKGVRGRIQWHLLALHGYQYFDLDGREPDTAMINWGRDGIIPTLAYFRCQEGADDFRYAVTLWNLAEGRQDAAAVEARQWLEQISAAIAVGQRSRPAGVIDDEQFRLECIERINRLRQ